MLVPPPSITIAPRASGESWAPFSFRLLAWRAAGWSVNLVTPYERRRRTDTKLLTNR